jgi:hypothetical protein
MKLTPQRLRSIFDLNQLEGPAKEKLFNQLESAGMDLCFPVNFKDLSLPPPSFTPLR